MTAALLKAAAEAAPLLAAQRAQVESKPLPPPAVKYATLKKREYRAARRRPRKPCWNGRLNHRWNANGECGYCGNWREKKI